MTQRTRTARSLRIRGLVARRASRIRPGMNMKRGGPVGQWAIRPPGRPLMLRNVLVPTVVAALAVGGFVLGRSGSAAPGDGGAASRVAVVEVVSLLDQCPQRQGVEDQRRAKKK